MRTCSECNLEKNESDYEVTFKNGRGYPRRSCKQCRNRKAYLAMRESDGKYLVKKERNRLRRQNPENRAKFVMSDSCAADKLNGWCNDLDVEFVEMIIANGCIYCECDSDIKIGIDRIDNSKPHNRANVVPCCTRCNFIRRNMPHEAWNRLVPTIRQITQEGLLDGWQFGFKHHITRGDQSPPS